MNFLSFFFERLRVRVGRGAEEGEKQTPRWVGGSIPQTEIMT